jgi:hypothetical protein
VNFLSQGCYTVILSAFESYVYLAGALAIGVLAVEVSEVPRLLQEGSITEPGQTCGLYPTACLPNSLP